MSYQHLPHELLKEITEFKFKKPESDFSIKVVGINKLGHAVQEQTKNTLEIKRLLEIIKPTEQCNDLELKSNNSNIKRLNRLEKRNYFLDLQLRKWTEQIKLQCTNTITAIETYAMLPQEYICQWVMSIISGDPLPDKVEIKKHTNGHGRHGRYYVNHNTKTTSWDHPDFEIKASSKPLSTPKPASSPSTDYCSIINIDTGMQHTNHLLIKNDYFKKFND